LSHDPSTLSSEQAASVAPAPRNRAVPIDSPLFVILNRKSGRHGAEDVRQTIEQTLTAAGRRFSVHEHEADDAFEASVESVVAEARAAGGIVVAAGGDGTINSVAAATLSSGCTFAVLPLGTFNYFSRAHGIPSDVAAACRILLGARAFEVQVGLINDRVFLVNASLGLYPKLLEEREAAKARLGRSRWVAFGAALHSLLRPHRRLRIDIEAKGGRRSAITQALFVGNNRLQLQRVGIPESDLIERHRLVAVVTRPVGLVGMLVLVLRAAWGRLGEAAAVTSFDFDRMCVRPWLGRSRHVKIARDGEVEQLSVPLTFRVAPQPLWLLRPADPGEDPG
jgi:diacylglycerol kinase family enzyme